MKSKVLLTFPRTGASSVVGTLRWALESHPHYTDHPKEVTDCHNWDLMNRLEELNSALVQDKVLATKMHLNKFINCQYTTIEAAVRWILDNRSKCDFVIMDRLSVEDLILSYLKAEHTNVWSGRSDLAAKIRIPKIAVRKSLAEYRFFSDLTAELDLPRITHEGIYQGDDLARMTEIYGWPKLNIPKVKYNPSIRDDFDNLEQILEWINQ
jgi:hypothetical protein